MPSKMFLKTILLTFQSNASRGTQHSGLKFYKFITKRLNINIWLEVRYHGTDLEITVMWNE